MVLHFLSGEVRIYRPYSEVVFDVILRQDGAKLLVSYMKESVRDAAMLMTHVRD